MAAGHKTQKCNIFKAIEKRNKNAKANKKIKK
jgi:hypothetical protein